MPKHQADDPGWVAPIYTSSNPADTARLQVLLEERGVSALLHQRPWLRTAYGGIGGALPTDVYQVLVASADAEAHPDEVAAALAELRQEIGPDSEVC